MNCLYTTLLGTDDYLYGVIGLYRSLMNSGTQYGFKAIVPDNIKLETIAILDECQVPYEIVVNTPFRMSGLENPFYCTLNKFQFLQWTEYDRIMFLDADTIVMVNPDILFTLEHECAGAVDNFEVEIPWYKGNAIILPPSVALWNRLTQLQNSITITNDEEVLNQLITPYIPMSKFWEYPYFFHEGPFVWDRAFAYKYWVKFNLTTISQLYDFIDTVHQRLILVNPPIDYEVIEPNLVTSLDDLIINTELPPRNLSSYYIWLEQ